MFHVKHNDITACDNCYSYATLTIALNVKYREGDPKELSMYGIRQSKLDPFYDFIIQCLNSGWSKSKTVKAIYEKGYSGSTSNAFDYLCKIEQRENKCFESQPYVRTMTECVTYSHHLNLIDFEVGASCSIALQGKDKTSYPRVSRGFYKSRYGFIALSCPFCKYPFSFVHDIDCRIHITIHSVSTFAIINSFR